MIQKLIKDDKVVIKIEGDTWKVWYPLDHRVESEEVNKVLGLFDIELKEFKVEDSRLDG